MARIHMSFVDSEVLLFDAIDWICSSLLNSIGFVFLIILLKFVIEAQEPVVEAR